MPEHVPTHSCKKCGAVEWSKSGTSWRCRPCKLAHSKQYHLDNHEERLAKRNAYIEANRKEIYSKNNEWRIANKEYELARLKKHYKENKSYYLAKGAKQRAARKQAIPAWFDREEVAYIYNLATERSLEVDHIVPLTSDIVCGLHVQDNLRCIPSKLNRFKGARYWPDMPLGG